MRTLFSELIRFFLIVSVLFACFFGAAAYAPTWEGMRENLDGLLGQFGFGAAWVLGSFAISLAVCSAAMKANTLAWARAYQFGRAGAPVLIACGFFVSDGFRDVSWTTIGSSIAWSVGVLVMLASVARLLYGGRSSPAASGVAPESDDGFDSVSRRLSIPEGDNHPWINPASGLAMVGFLDVAGNAYGSNQSSDHELFDHGASLGADSFDSSSLDFSSSSDSSFDNDSFRS